jgi:protein-tyrosine-phosphatase
MAHAILLHEAQARSLDIDVYSAGIVDFSDQPPLKETSRTCLYYDTPAPKETPTWAAELPLASIDRFLVMEQEHADALEHQFRVPTDRISLLGTFDPQKRGAEIVDPFFSYSEDVYRTSYRLIRDCILGYLNIAGEVR